MPLLLSVATHLDALFSALQPGMASSTGMDSRVVPALAASNTALLPLDAIYEILLRLPAKALCRLRTVCRLWRCLLSDPSFAAANAARHPGPPLIVAHCTSDLTTASSFLDVMDLSSGRVLKRVRMTVAGATEGNEMVSTHLNLVRFWRGVSGIRLLTPADGAVHALPHGLAQEHETYGLDITGYSSMLASGQIATTGHCKVLRVLDSYPNDHPGQLYEVYTLHDCSHARWRGKGAPPHNVDFGNWSGVVIRGIVYFLSDEFVHGQDAGPDRIASFDLETEEWNPSLRGPLSSLQDDDDDDYARDCYDYSLASLCGHLVLAHRTPTHSMNLWFLMDSDICLWVRQHVIQISATVHPLLLLNDGRIILINISSGFLKAYNPSTNTFTDIAEIGHYHAVGLYTGSLLSLPYGTS